MPLHTPVRIGVLGAGWFASRRHCPDIVAHHNAELTALCRRSRQQLQQMADAFSVEHTFTEYRAMLDSGLLDGVLVCSPHHLHYEHAKAALERGLHVLLEKPITLDPDQGRQLLALADEKDLALVVAQNPPYWNHCHYLRDKIRHNALGEIEGVSINWMGNARAVLGLEPLPEDMPGIVKPTLYRADSAQNGGGFLIDGGSHLICELLWCTGRKVVEVTAQMDDADFDLRCALTLRLDNGAYATLSQCADSRIRAKRQHSIYYGSAGTVAIHGFPFKVKMDSGTVVEEFREDELKDPPTPVGDLIRCALGEGKPQIDGETAVHVVEIIQSAAQAAREGRAVRIRTAVTTQGTVRATP